MLYQTYAWLAGIVTRQRGRNYQKRHFLAYASGDLREIFLSRVFPGVTGRTNG